MTVTGPGGVGKTRLAGEVAGRVVGWFREGVWLVELAGVGEPSPVAAAAVAALDLRAERGVSLLEWLVRALSRRQLLLALANCENMRTRGDRAGPPRKPGQVGIAESFRFLRAARLGGGIRWRWRRLRQPGWVIGGGAHGARR